MVDSHVPPELAKEPDEGGGEISGACIGIPAGKYELAYIDYRTGCYFGGPKVVVLFSIINHDTYAGLTVEKFYNVESIEHPPKKYGKYKASARGQLVRDMRRLLGNPLRLDRISFVSLKDKTVLARLETVKINSKRQPLPRQEQYTKVAELLHIGDDDF